MNTSIRLAGITLCTAAILTACTSAPTTVSQVATDANLIATGLSAAVTAISTMPGIDQTKLATLQADLATVQKDAATIAAATSVPTTTDVQQIEQDVEAVAPIALALVPGGSVWIPVIDAAISLAPELVADIEGTSSVAGVTPMSANTYSPDAARVILRGAAAR